MKSMEKLKRKVKNNFSNILLAISIVMLFLVIALIYKGLNSKPIYFQEYEVIFSVAPGGAGFDVNGTALTFGIIPPDGTARRQVIIDNNYDFPVRVEVKTTENLLGFIESDNRFVLQPGENKTLEVSVIIPAEAEFKEYRGKLRLDFYKLK